MSDVYARQDVEVFGHKIDVPSESPAYRLSSALDHINETASSWYDGSLDSVVRRMGFVRGAMTLARQIHSEESDLTFFSLNAIDVERSLGHLYQALHEAHEQLALSEVDLPQFSINSA